jgi:hypothetical protein
MRDATRREKERAMRSRRFSIGLLGLTLAAATAAAWAADTPSGSATVPGAPPDAPAIGSKVFVELDRPNPVTGALLARATDANASPMPLTAVGGTLLQLNDQWVAVTSTDAGGRKNDYWIPRGKVIFIRVDESARGGGGGGGGGGDAK